MFLKNKTIIFKSRRSKVTDYAALSYQLLLGYFTQVLLYFMYASKEGVGVAVCKNM